MKILTFSDLHGQLSSLKKLIQLEAHNGYDAILAVGDIGAYGKTRLNAKEVVSMLSAFSCPVLFVLGNSDPEHTVKDVDWPENGVLLSEEPTMLGEYAVVGLNSIYNVSLRTNKTNHDYSDQKFKVLSESITKYKIDPQHVIMLTHERMYHLKEGFTAGPPLLYLFGHHHDPRHTVQQHTNFINCSVLDNSRNRWGAGNYWVLNIDDESVTATPKPLRRPTIHGILAGGRWNERQQKKLFNQLYPDLKIPDPISGTMITPIDDTMFPD